MQETDKNKNPNIFAKWIKRFGVAGFLFFLIKGVLLYIVVPVLVAYFAW